MAYGQAIRGKRDARVAHTGGGFVLSRSTAGGDMTGFGFKMAAVFCLVAVVAGS